MKQTLDFISADEAYKKTLPNKEKRTLRQQKQDKLNCHKAIQKAIKNGYHHVQLNWYPDKSVSSELFQYGYLVTFNPNGTTTISWNKGSK